jgi:DNA-directed RNA polymerase specialized sigma24 family protein
VSKKARKRAPAAAEDDAGNGTSALERIAGLLALLVVKDLDKEAAAVRLGGVGFSDREIAGIIGVTVGYVRLSRFRAKGAKKTRKRKAS